MLLLIRLFLSLQILLLGGYTSLNAYVQQQGNAHATINISDKTNPSVSLPDSDTEHVKPYSSLVRKERAVLDDDDDTEDHSKKQLKADNSFHALSYIRNPGDLPDQANKYIQYGKPFFYSSCRTHILYRVIRI